MLNFREELSRVKEEKHRKEEKIRKNKAERHMNKNIKVLENLLEKLLQYFLEKVDFANFSKGVKFSFNVQGMYIYCREYGRYVTTFSSKILDSYEDAELTFNYLKEKFKDEGYEITSEEKKSFEVIIKA